VTPRTPRPTKDTAAQGVDRSDRLSLDQIVETAVRLTAEQGLSTLTMRRIAEELGVTPMATYYYVSNKDELIDLVIDAVMGAVVIPSEKSGSWSERLWHLNRASRKAMAAHPGVAEELISRPRTAASKRHVDAIVAMLEEAGFDAKEAVLAYNMFEACMFGQFVVDRSERITAHDDRSYRWTFDTLIAGFEARIAATGGSKARSPRRQ